MAAADRNESAARKYLSSREGACAAGDSSRPSASFREVADEEPARAGASIRGASLSVLMDRRFRELAALGRSLITRAIARRGGGSGFEKLICLVSYLAGVALITERSPR